jgi:hypothetical protein
VYYYFQSPLGIQTYPNMPVTVNSTFIGNIDDAGDIDYRNFIPNMALYRHNLSLDVGMLAL